MPPNKSWIGLFFLIGINACWAEEKAVVITLFDFEQGVSEWRANPWSGGKGYVEPAPETKFGRGALRVRYENVPQGCNMISPYFAPDAPWRQGDYDALCFWLKGDGTPSYLHVYLASEVGDFAPTHSGQVPLSSTQWQRFCLKFDNLWNREGRPFQLAHLKRIYFGASGTHEALIDHVQLQKRLRNVPLEPQDHAGPAAITPALFADSQEKYFLTFDPHSVLEPSLHATLTIQWPQQKPLQTKQTLLGQQAQEELWLALPGQPTAAGQGQMTLSLHTLAGERCYLGRFRFPVAEKIAPLEPEELQLVPRPKFVRLHPYTLKLPAKLSAYIFSQEQLARVGLRHIQQDLGRIWGRSVDLKRPREQKWRLAVLVLTPEYERPEIPTEIGEHLAQLRPQGYVLHINNKEILLAALDEAGMHNAALTLKQALLTASPSAEEATAPGLTVVDWPSLPIRAVNIGLPTTRWGYPNDAPVSADFFRDFLQRTVVDLKFNVVGLEVLQGMKFESHPEMNGPAAWSKEEVRRIVEFLQEQGVDVFPIVNSLGHANWLVIPFPEYREDNDSQTLCTRHPRIRAVLTDIYEEVRDVFSPRYFHFGLDEIRWQTLNVPPEKRCPRCAGLDKRQLFEEHVQFLHAYAKSRQMQMLMWADMLLPQHNGGPPFFLADTLERLPKDIILCNWSATLAPLSLWDLQRRGFTVWKCNSRGVNSAQLPFVAGNMWGIWSKTPWLTESCWRALSYSYLNQIVASEYSWNVYPDVMADGVPLESEFFVRRPLAQQRLAAVRKPDMGAICENLAPGEQRIQVAGLKLQPWAAPTREKKIFPVGKPCSVLYALITAELPSAKRKEFEEEFKKKENWQGVPVGQFIFRYEDGSQEAEPILYAYHLRAAEPADTFPYAYGALATTLLTAEEQNKKWAYLIAFANPQPQKHVAEIIFQPGNLAAQPELWALALRSVRRTD